MILVLAGCASLCPKEVVVPKNLDTYSGLSAALAAGEDIFLYDVREPEEYESGYIPGAINIPDYEFLEEPPPLKKDDIIVLYCVSGLRSTSVHKMLSNNGYKYVYDFGGLWKWEGELVISD
jgi:rhodanese-related sulfurtransferase